MTSSRKAGNRFGYSKKDTKENLGSCNNMEELLNKLTEKGWKPRGYEDVYEFKLYKGGYTINRPQKQKLISFATETRHYINGTDYIGYKGYSLRELVSKESGLWQFVCENGMEKKMEKNHRGIWINSWAKSAYQSYPVYTMERYEYRIIESSLKDESELEDFLLNSIKLD